VWARLGELVLRLLRRTDLGSTRIHVSPELPVELVESGDLRVVGGAALRAVVGVEDGSVELRSRLDAVELLLVATHLEVLGEGRGVDVPTGGKLHRDDLAICLLRHDAS